MYLDLSESLALVINQVYSSAHLKFLLVTAISSVCQCCILYLAIHIYYSNVPLIPRLFQHLSKVHSCLRSLSEEIVIHSLRKENCFHFPLASLQMKITIVFCH